MYDSLAEQPGAVKKGSGLLTGLLRCRRCGRKLTVRYTGSRREVLCYACNRGWVDHGELRCIAFGGVPVDDSITKQVLEVVRPAAVEAALLASNEQVQRHDDAIAALRRDLEAARYAAQRAQRQYDAADPEDRLVAGELERRWIQPCSASLKIETRIQSQMADEQHAAATPEEFAGLAEQLDLVWNNPHTDASLKKRIVRTLIQEVVADVDSNGVRSFS